MYAVMGRMDREGQIGIYPDVANSSPNSVTCLDSCLVVHIYQKLRLGQGASQVVSACKA